MTTILNKLNWYKSKDEAFANEPGDNFFFVNGLWTCISENDAIFLEMLDAGYKTEMQIYLEKIANK